MGTLIVGETYNMGLTFMVGGWLSYYGSGLYCGSNEQTDCSMAENTEGGQILLMGPLPTISPPYVFTPQTNQPMKAPIKNNQPNKHL